MFLFLGFVSHPCRLQFLIFRPILYSLGYVLLLSGKFFTFIFEVGKGVLILLLLPAYSVKMLREPPIEIMPCSLKIGR